MTSALIKIYKSTLLYYKNSRKEKIKIFKVLFFFPLSINLKYINIKIIIIVEKKKLKFSSFFFFFHFL